MDKKLIYLKTRIFSKEEHFLAPDEKSDYIARNRSIIFYEENLEKAKDRYKGYLEHFDIKIDSNIFASLSGENYKQETEIHTHSYLPIITLEKLMPHDDFLEYLKDKGVSINVQT